MPKPKLLSRKLLQSRPARLLDATVSAGDEIQRLKTAPSGGFHRPRLRGDDKNHGLRPNVSLDAFPQCAGDSEDVLVRVALIHGVRKNALSGGSFDVPVPVVVFHICVQILVILPTGRTTQFNANK